MKETEKVTVRSQAERMVDHMVSCHFEILSCDWKSAPWRISTIREIMSHKGSLRDPKLSRNRKKGFRRAKSQKSILWLKIRPIENRFRGETQNTVKVRLKYCMIIESSLYRENEKDRGETLKRAKMSNSLYWESLQNPFLTTPKIASKSELWWKASGVQN